MGAGAVEDEPGELNWYTLGGTVTGFSHFRDYCRANSDFRRKIIAEKSVVNVADKPVNVNITAADFADASVRQWGERDIDGVRCLILQSGHNGLMIRTGFDVPETGFYRVWVKYRHSQVSSASFELTLEDGRLAAESDPAVTVGQNAFSWRFDAVEFGRKNNALPNHRDEPTGWIWEPSPLVRLEKGRRAISLRGLTHDGSYAERQVASIVLTTEPLARPDEAPSLADSETRELWVRRPMCAAGPSPALKQLWREWRRVFLADLAQGKLSGVEAGRMAGTVCFDDEENLIGTPKQIADAKEQMRKFLAGNDRMRFKCKIEAEDFEIKSGWYLSDNGGASGGRVLSSSYGGEVSDAWKDVLVPSNGTYHVWLRYCEIGGYLAKWHFKVEKADGSVIGERPLQCDWTENKAHPGLSWIKMPLKLEKGKVRLLLHKSEVGSTYRNVDTAIVTDDLLA